MQRFYSIVFAGLTPVLAALVGAQPVRAAEQLLIPFQCSVAAGRVLARPSESESFRIVGERETAPYTACARHNPNRCRTIMLHRFDVDCDGTRVAWPELYAAISKLTPRRARMHNGRLLINVRPERSRPRTRHHFGDDEPYSGQRGYTFVVEMPEGFAPIRGTLARFAGRPSPAPVQRQAENRSQYSKQAAPVEKSIATQPTRKPVIKQAVPDNDKSKVTALKPQLKSLPKPIFKPVPKTEVAAKNKAEPKTTPPKTQTKETAALQKKSITIPTIINAKKPIVSPAQKSAIEPNPKPLQTSKKNGGNTDSGTATVQQGPKASSDNSSKGRENSNAPKPVATAAKSDSSAQPANNVSSAQTSKSPTLGTTLLVLLIVATMLLSFATASYRLLSRRRRSGSAPARRDIASVNLTPSPLSDKDDKTHVQLTGLDKNLSLGPQNSPSIAAEQTLTELTPPRPEPTLSAGPVPKSVHLPAPKLLPQLPMPNPTSGTNETDRTRVTTQTDVTALVVPKTRQEALTALGIGDKASPEVIEKVIASLHQSWHLNDATDEADREFRRRRMAQITAASRILEAEPLVKQT